ncbi:fibronectin type III domain-containing protein [Sporolactobacillus sp. CQH2019]|uniref:phage tail tube protein n=1 Tax=Sporolactobacillus sp. CQH2019 TaxID=3023512 RepID=UPI0023680575|nr:fibronectin type III domain-containing protein [Sporolactobacillus sp. CQH2019]MDD9147825.1 fibronectin type III domain-containing protein [Sporolactobacillus sp. CQH2019]
MVQFNLNYKNRYEIDKNGGMDPSDVSSAQWLRLATGIQTITPAPGDTTDNTPYYDGGGFAQTDRTGMNFSLAFAGNRVEGDPAQDFVESKQFALGDAAKTLLRWTKTNGVIIIAQVSLTAIITAGGAANAKQTFSFTLNFNGAPTTTSGLTAPTGLAGTPTANSVALTWGAIAGATMYHVYRSGILIASPSTNSFTDTGLQASTAYIYQVSAVDETGFESLPTAPLNETTTA